MVHVKAREWAVEWHQFRLAYDWIWSTSLSRISVFLRHPFGRRNPRRRGAVARRTADPGGAGVGARASTSRPDPAGRGDRRRDNRSDDGPRRADVSHAAA